LPRPSLLSKRPYLQAAVLVLKLFTGVKPKMFRQGLKAKILNLAIGLSLIGLGVLGLGVSAFLFFKSHP